MRTSIIKDRKLAPEGHRKIRWVEAHSPVLNALFEKRPYLKMAFQRR